MPREKESDFPIVLTPALERAAQGCCPLLADDKAREDWIACCSRRFFPLAKRIVDDDDLAREALQISWIKIFQAANVSLRGPTAWPWVASVVANSAKDLRRQQRRRREVELEAVEIRSAGRDLESTVQDRQSSWLRSSIGWVEAHVLRVETALTSGMECDTGCFGHYQGPKNLLGCGLYGGCGTYCASDPTEFYWEDGCIDCTINDPDNDCDGCSVDQACSHPPIGGADSDSAVSPLPGGETP